MIRIRTIAPLTLAMLLGGALPCQTPAGPVTSERQVLAMGTRLTFQVQGASPQAVEQGTESAIGECARIEAAGSTWHADSLFSRLNAAEGEALPLAEEWLNLLKRAQGWCRRTGGTFDPVLFRLLSAHGVRDGGRDLGAAELAQARAASGSRLLRLDVRHGTAQLDHGAGLEEGGFLKGYALDRMKLALTRKGCPSGCLDFGGQLLVFGTAIQVSIADPKDRQKPRFALLLKAASLASSGLSEHGRHIVDPRTGGLCEDWGSVSVLAANGLDADCLSTALYVMGPEAGLAWSRRHRIAAIFLRNDGSVCMSPAFKALEPVPLPTR